MTKLPAAGALLLALLAAVPSTAQDKAMRPTYAGRTLVDVLQALNRQGLRIVFSSSLVRPDLRVATEPAGQSPREILDQVLTPHGLHVRTGPRGVLIVTRLPRPAAAPAGATARPGTLRGRVVDAESDQPLTGVLVVSHEPERRVTTDALGRFEFEGLTPGRLSLFVSLVGYVLSRPDIEIPSAGVADIVVPLTAGAGAYTEQLTVRGTDDSTRSATPSVFTIRSAELQELRGVLADDPFRAMQTMPNAATGDDFRAEFSVRGSDFRQMGLSLDGMPAPWLVHSVRAVEDTATIAMINADALDEVTLSSGATPQLFGNRTGAWLDTGLREGSRDAFRLGGMLSGTGASVVAEGPLGRERRGAWLVSVRKSYIDWLIRQLDTQEQTSFGFSDAQSTLRFDLTPRHQLRLTAVAGRSKMDEPDDTPSINGVRIGRAATAMTIAAWRAALGSSFVVTQRTAWSGLRFHNTNDFGQDVAEGREWNWTYRADLGWAPRAWAAVDAGASVDREWATLLTQQYGSVGGNPPALRGWDTFERQRWRQGGYMRIRVNSSSAFGLEGGARLDRESINHESTASPWVLSRWTLSDRWAVRAGAGVARQLPDLSQLSPPGTPAPASAERARYLDLSAEYRVTPSLLVQASVFDRSETGVLRQDVPSPRIVNGTLFGPFASGLWANALNVAARGVEFTVRRTASAGLVGWVSYAYGHTRNTEVATGEQYWGDFDQRHLLNVHASYRLGSRTNASAKLRIGSNMPVAGYFQEQDGSLALGRTRNDVRLPTYSRLDLRLSRTYNYTKRRLTLFAEIINVLNRENLGRTDGVVRSNGTVSGFVETLFPLLPSAGIRIEF